MAIKRLDRIAHDGDIRLELGLVETPRVIIPNLQNLFLQNKYKELVMALADFRESLVNVRNFTNLHNFLDLALQYLITDLWDSHCHSQTSTSVPFVELGDQDASDPSNWVGPVKHEP